MADLSDPDAWYRARRELFTAEAERLRAHSEWLGMARLVLFVALVVTAAWSYSAAGGTHIVAVAAALVALFAFVALIVVHGSIRERFARATAVAELNRRGAARVERDWKALPIPRLAADPAHPYATDLDVVGECSLVQLLDVTTAAPGRTTLARWLLEPPPDSATILARQAAVRDLAPRAEWREELALLAYGSAEMRPDDFEGFLQWAESPGWLLSMRAVVVLSWIIPVVTIGGFVLALMHLLPWQVPAVSLVAGLLLVARYARPLGETVAAVTARATGLRQQALMLALVERARFEAPLLVGLHHQVAAAGGARRALDRLEHALGVAEGRGGMLYGIGQALVLWDFHVVARLERWRRDAGTRARGWLQALGEVEALAALATLAFDNPAWTFPCIEPTDRVVAEALAHPLLPASRVANDVAVGPPGTLLLVTGSNMSGKSTLLRAIGLNVVLAQAGGPVCARRLTMPLLDVRTSIRVADSLARGVSLFMAELRRLKEIVDAARAPNRDRMLLYLLDEILHGTNSAERQVAARAVLGQLVGSGAIGVVTTHDLALAAEGELVGAGVPVHFTETVGEGEQGMSFDYRLRPGPATSTNALALLRMVGL